MPLKRSTIKQKNSAPVAHSSKAPAKAPAPVAPAQASAPVAPVGEKPQSFMGEMASMFVTSTVFGMGSSLGHRTMDYVFGPRTVDVVHTTNYNQCVRHPDGTSTNCPPEENAEK